MFTLGFGSVGLDEFPKQIRDSLSVSACWENPGNLAFSLSMLVLTEPADIRRSEFSSPGSHFGFMGITIFMFLN